jgi:hypothetical protein
MTMANPSPVKRKRGRPKKSEERTAQEKKEEERRKTLYDDIPLGAQGAKMMTSFGDGKVPNPEAVEAALLGARRLLQVTIQDARALRRKAKHQFLQAQADVAKPNKSKLRAAAKNNKKNNSNNSPPQTTTEQQQQLADPHMLYRALEGYDTLSYEPKCGFDYEQLKALFPEEMNAYARWTQVRSPFPDYFS